MNKKERLMASVRFKQVDRPPTSFRASKKLAQRLYRHFGIDESSGIEGRRELLRKLGADFWSSGSKIGSHSTFIPTYKGERPKKPYIEDGSLFYTLGIGVKLGRIDEYDFDYPVYVDPPLASVESPNEIKPGFLTDKLDLYAFDRMINKAAPAQSLNSLQNTENKQFDPYSYESLMESGQDFICMGTLSNIFMICCYLRGMEQFMLDLVSNRPVAECIIGEVSEFCLEFNRRELADFGSKAEFYGTWDDLASQNGLMFSPKLFNQYFLPYYKELIDNVKRYDLIFSWHICGSVHQVLPAMIDAGLDIFDVVQTSARDMELENLYRLYGKDVCFHGAVDVQQLLVFGTPEQVKEEVRKIIDLWGPQGGIIIAPSHEAVPETPIENIIAIYEQVHDLEKP